MLGRWRSPVASAKREQNGQSGGSYQKLQELVDLPPSWTSPMDLLTLMLPLVVSDDVVAVERRGGAADTMQEAEVVSSVEAAAAAFEGLLEELWIAWLNRRVLLVLRSVWEIPWLQQPSGLRRKQMMEP